MSTLKLQLDAPRVESFQATTLASARANAAARCDTNAAD